KLQELRGDPADAGLSEHCGERARLFVGAEHGAAHEPREIGTLRNEGVEARQRGIDRIEGVGLERKLEQCGRIAARHAGYGPFLACHVGCSWGWPNPRIRTDM